MMNVILRVSVCVGALAVAFAGLELANPGWMVELGPALAEFYDQRARLDHERKLARRLVEEDACLLEKSACKQRVLDDLLADRISLWQAAARFRDLEAASPMRSPSHLASFYPGASEEERSCRQVIAHAEVRIADRPDKGASLVQTLTAQLEEALSFGSSSDLPD